MPTHSGFLLLECCVSLLLLGLISGLVSSWYIQLMSVEQATVQRIQAIMLAQSLIEHYKAYGRPPLYKTKNGFAISWEITSDKHISDFMHVRVTLRGNSDGKYFSLSTGFIPSSWTTSDA